MKRKYDYKIGIISDTHGLVRPRVTKLFKDVDLIVHAGDVGKPDVLEALQTITKVYSVRGNVDTGKWANRLPETEIIQVGQIDLCILHDLNELDIDPVAAEFSVVISGHSHIPEIEERNGVLFVNPGSAGPGRSDYPISIAFLYINGLSIDTEIVRLKD